jgi:hypothetical protein
MNDIQQARSDALFARAQAAYDRQEPQEYPGCSVCDGSRKVAVAIIFDVNGKHLTWPAEKNLVEVECPFCVDGVQPLEPDPDRKYDLLREEQWDGDYEIQRRDSLEDLPR